MSRYKPKVTAMSAYATMQELARTTRISVDEMARELGFSCGWEWQKAIMEAFED